MYYSRTNCLKAYVELLKQDTKSANIIQLICHTQLGYFGVCPTENLRKVIKFGLYLKEFYISKCA